MKAKVEPFNNSRCSSVSYLPTPTDDFIVDVGDHHPVDDRDPEKPGENPLQDVKADIGAAGRQNSGLFFLLGTQNYTLKNWNQQFIRQDRKWAGIFILLKKSFKRQLHNKGRGNVGPNHECISSK